jgi:hypothetical protein
MAVKTNDFDAANIRNFGDLTICESIRYGFKYQTKVRWEEVTVAADSNTTSTATLIPANCLVTGVAHRVTVAVPTTDGTVDIGTAASATAFQDDAASTVNQTGVKHLATEYTSATGIKITPCSTPTAATGKIMLVVFYTQITAPTSSP